MKITLFLSLITVVTSISIFIGRETEITTEKTVILGRLKVSVIAKETPGKRGFVLIREMENEWKIKWSECTEQLRSQVSLSLGIPIRKLPAFTVRLLIGD